MSLLQAEFRDQCRGLRRLAMRTWAGRLLGRRPDARLAAGTSATDQCDYTNGDDIRYIDWNRCARHDELLSRRFEGREDHHVHLLLDCSASMRVGEPKKFELARRVAAAIGYLALAGHERVGAAVFAESTRAQLPPVAGNRGLSNLLAFFDTLTVTQEATDLRAAAAAHLRGRPRPGLVVLVSDLLDPEGYRPAIDLLRGRHQVHVMQLYARCEAEPSELGPLRLNEVETGRSHRLCAEARDLKNYRIVFGEFLRSVQSYCASRGVELTQVAADVDFAECLASNMRKSHGVS